VRRQSLCELSAGAWSKARREDLDHLQQLRRIRQSAVRHSSRGSGLGAHQHHARPGRHGLHPRSCRSEIRADRRQSARAAGSPRGAAKARHRPDRGGPRRHGRGARPGEFQQPDQRPVRDRARARGRLRRPRSGDDHLHLGHHVTAERRDALPSRRGHGCHEQRHRDASRPQRRHHRAVSAVPLRGPRAAAELSVAWR
jgi:hypothetical protein